MGSFHSQRCRTFGIFLLLLNRLPDQGALSPSPQTDRDVDAIDIGNSNTVRTLRDQLARLVRAGYANTGFPIIDTDENGKSRMLGFIGGNELEHALSTFLRISSGLLICAWVPLVLVLIRCFFFRYRRRGSGSPHIFPL